MDRVFETARLIVRKFKIEDAQCLYAHHLEEDVKRWFPNECYADMEETVSAIGFYVDRVEHKKLPYVLAVELKETGELIGDTGISEVDGRANEVEIGYIIGKEFRAKGYATEVLSAMTAFAFSSFGVNTVYARVICGNDASVRVLEKSGYCFVEKELGAADDPYDRGMLVYKKDRF